MGLFSQLERLARKEKFQLEDFHTEIVAQVLRNSPALTLAWLQAIDATRLQDPESITIATQEEFVKLADHATDSRPDIAIRLVTGNTVELILIESKIGAKQGPDQLKRYAEQLLAKPDLAQTTLIFITRDFEPVQNLSKLPANFRFLLARWFEFFYYLESHLNGDGLAIELKLFMEKHNMALRNKFRPVDTLALESFLPAKELVDETLWTQVAKEFEQVLGKISSRTRAMSQLGVHSRYVMYVQFQKNAFECLLGYWLPADASDSLWLGVTLTSNPNSPLRKAVIAAYRELLKSTDWGSEDLSEDRLWASVYKGKDLQSFLGEEDQVEAIKTYFLMLLREVKQFKAANPKLPWGAQEADTEEA
jgi:hypothetical protein